MEKFMFLFHGGSQPDASPQDMHDNMAKWMAWIGKLNETQQYVAGEPLLPGGKLVSGPGRLVTDGPYTEGKEVVGGFFIVLAKDYDEAVQLAMGCPDFEKGGSVQIRQVMKVDM